MYKFLFVYMFLFLLSIHLGGVCSFSFSFDVFSFPCYLNVGVPLGLLLGPLLFFSIHIHTLNEHFKIS